MPDREKVIKGLNNISREIINTIGHGEAIPYLRTIDDAIFLLKEQPEIVRCKDCKHFQSGMDINGRPFTRCNGRDENNRIFKSYGNTEPDWFCADVERKEVE